MTNKYITPLFLGFFIRFAIFGFSFFARIFIGFITYDTNISEKEISTTLILISFLLLIPFLVMGYQFIKKNKTIELIGFSAMPITTILYLTLTL